MAVCTHQRPVESGGGVLHGEGRVGVLLRRGVARAVHAYSTVQINIKILTLSDEKLQLYRKTLYNTF